MRWRREVATWLVLLIVGAVVAVIYVAGRGKGVQTGPYHGNAARLRGLLTGFVVYAQNNRDAFPPPAEAQSLLVKGGALSPELFESPPSAPGEATFYVVMPTIAAGWSNSIKDTRPLVYAHPALFGGSSTLVGFTDGHVELVTLPELDRIVKDSGGSVEAVK